VARGVVKHVRTTNPINSTSPCFASEISPSHYLPRYCGSEIRTAGYPTYDKPFTVVYTSGKGMLEGEEVRGQTI